MLIIIGIADTNDMNKRKSYGYEKNIIEYNRILVEISDEFGCSYVDMFNEGDGIIFSDGIHLNKEGCNIISKRIFSILTDSKS
jgi:lysophospholipase L1-like esterase